MESVKLEFRSLEKGTLGVLTLNRPEVSNALSGEMVDRMMALITEVDARGESCRALVLRAEGKHFSGGADLDWMKQSANLSYEENLAESRKLAGLFKALAHVKIPTIVMVHGAELKKVTWPTRDEVVRSTTVVIICILIASFILAGFDVLFGKVVGYFLKG